MPMAAVVVARRQQPTLPVVEVVESSMAQSARAVTFSVAIIMLVYIPLLTLEGVEGKMFRPMAITMACALFGALVYSVLFFLALGFLPQIHNQCASIHFFGHATDQHVQLTLVKAEDFNVTKYQRLQLFL
jgi:multidrug efflux pump subunit AcrB